ncbi:MAG: SRPBCC family protein [Tepidiformaceae bacterium]
MTVHRLEAHLQLSASLDEVWAFFADPRNLAHITPPEMGFTVKGEVPEQMYAGLLIAYTVKPLFGIPVEWLTEITHIEPNRYFVDEQRRGPYRLWHHQHHFLPVEGGVEMHDILHYELPLGPFGDLLDRALVRRRIEQIFAYRRAALLRRFSTYSSSPAGSGEGARG